MKNQEKQIRKNRSTRKVSDGLLNAKNTLISILGDMEDLGQKKAKKLHTIICKVEALQHEVK